MGGGAELGRIRLLVFMTLALSVAGKSANALELVLRDYDGKAFAQFPMDIADERDPIFRVLLHFANPEKNPVTDQDHLVVAGFLWSRATDPSLEKDAALARMAALDHVLRQLSFIHYQSLPKNPAHWSNRPVDRVLEMRELALTVLEVVKVGFELPGVATALGNYLFGLVARNSASRLENGIASEPETMLLNSDISHALFVRLVVELYAYAVADRLHIPDELRAQIHLRQVDALGELLVNVSRQLEGLNRAPGGDVLRRGLVEDIIIATASLGIAPELLKQICRSSKVLGLVEPAGREEWDRTLEYIIDLTEEFRLYGFSHSRIPIFVMGFFVQAMQHHVFVPLTFLNAAMHGSRVWIASGEGAPIVRGAVSGTVGVLNFACSDACNLPFNVALSAARGTERMAVSAYGRYRSDYARFASCASALQNRN